MHPDTRIRTKATVNVLPSSPAPESFAWCRTRGLLINGYTAIRRPLRPYRTPMQDDLLQNGGIHDEW